MGLDAVQILWDIEKAFDVEILDAEAEATRTIEDLHLLVMQKTAARSPEPTAVWQKIQDIIVENAGVPRDRVKPGSTFHELGID
jgi:acyl carrier protein